MLDTMTSGKSWAEQVDQGDEGLPPPTEEFDEKRGIKTITEYRNEDGKVIKTIKTYKIETVKLSKSIAQRKMWKKYGAAANDPPGPNPSNTIMTEEVFMQFVQNKETPVPEEEDPLSKLTKQKIVQCRICKGDHWTTKCPYKDTLQPLQEKLEEGAKKPDIAPVSSSPAPNKPAGGKYIPPTLREGANKGRGETMSNQRKGDEAATIRVTNLSEDTRESDLQELFRPFGPISRIYLAKDKNTGQSKGFAFINFHRREDASRAIQGVSGFGYDHLILNVEWAKPSTQQ
ncbi:Eukaryotic translation initiation factor 3 subunit G [Biomphalaria glabrata]|uniref:Eukaryotic translation initiation factor 3 subunit G n=2 Tax=Biomphalaria TaxID=6525 RepID=A0A9W3B897_BIOGL|nr:eukaryotic translation initiation factor 3 subunit G-like [Biomphalaria glabrata]KAI8748590.1 eukaryotic translation initiation factor 3 subunit G [Biomphalaria glabrata]KAI8779532.1 eukaryotic translation initiation factor 3 subunit G [Biomphalaria glabrata]KAK0065621.1 eukaryotic translation initiation factor 3 subunit G [Biomphalaria pfeifferi]